MKRRVEPGYLTTNPPEAVSPQAAWLLLEQITRLPNHSFWANSIALTDSVIFQNANIIGYRQVTDAYLLSLAIDNDSQLVSFDKGIRALLLDEYRGSLRIIDVEIV